MEKNIEISSIAKSVSDLMLEEADKRNHKDETVGSGLGDLIGGALGSFLGPVGSLVSGGLGALEGYLLAGIIKKD